MDVEEAEIEKYSPAIGPIVKGYFSGLKGFYKRVNRADGAAQREAEKLTSRRNTRMVTVSDRSRR